MAITNYVVGAYVKINLLPKKWYVPTLYNIRGEHIRYSLIKCKTATAAKEWAKRWASGVNKRSKGKFVILVPTEDRDGRMNVTFEDTG